MTSDLQYCTDVPNLEDLQNISWFTSVTYSEGLRLLNYIQDGYTTLENLGRLLTPKEYCKGPLNPPMTFTHRQIACGLLEIAKNYVSKNQEADANVSFLPPIIQSGGSYNLNMKTESDETDYKDDVVIFCVKLKYKNWYASVTRTIVTLPIENQDVLKNYLFLQEVQMIVINELKDGVTLGNIYQSAIDYVHNKRPDMTKYLSDNFGSFFEMNSNNEHVIEVDSISIAKENTIFNVRVGVHDIIDQNVIPRAPHKYSLWIGDDVWVKKGEPAVRLTQISNGAETHIFYEDRKFV